MTLLFVSLLFLLSLLFEFCSPSLPFGWCCFCPPLVTAIGAGGFVNTLLFCCCCCCVVASAWNAPVSEKNESGVILSDISARRARRARFARLARALDSERDFPFFLLLPSVTPQNDSDKWKECRSFFNRGAVVKRYQLWWNALHKAA